LRIMMNKTTYLILFIAVAGIFSSCREDRVTDIGTPFSKIEGLTMAPYELTTVSIIDGVDPARAQRDFTSFYLGGEQILSIDFSDDMTFTVIQGDMGLNFLPESGTWSFDNPDAPSQIILNDGTTNQVLNLNAPTRKVDPTLEFSYDKYSCEIDGEVTAVYSYSAVFDRAN